MALLDRLRRGKQHHRERKLLRVANHEELELAFPPPLRPGSSALRLTQGLGFHFFLLVLSFVFLWLNVVVMVASETRWASWAS